MNREMKNKRMNEQTTRQKSDQKNERAHMSSY